MNTLEEDIYNVIKKTMNKHDYNFYLMVSEKIYNAIHSNYSRQVLNEDFIYIAGIKIYKGLGLDNSQIIPIIKSKRHEQEAKNRIS
jgi:hypothetical protein